MIEPFTEPAVDNVTPKMNEMIERLILLCMMMMMIMMIISDAVNNIDD